jgi:hypothetical protein
MKPESNPRNFSKCSYSFTRTVHRAILLVMFGCCVLAASATPTAPAGQPQQTIAEKFIGTWRLVSVEGNSPMRTVRYDHPSGLIIYDRSGWMITNIAVHGERKPFAGGLSAGTVEEKADAFDSYLAYYGTYTLDEKAETVTHHLTDHSYPGYRGRDNVRWFEFQGDNRIVLIPTEDGKGGSINRKDATYKLTWERIR